MTNKTRILKNYGQISRKCSANQIVIKWEERLSTAQVDSEQSCEIQGFTAGGVGREVLSDNSPEELLSNRQFVAVHCGGEP